MRRTYPKLLGLFALATGLGLFFASQSYLAYLYRDGQANFWASVKFNMPDWYAWAVATPLIIWLARRFPFDGKRWLRSLAFLAPLGVLITLAKLGLVAYITDAVAWLPGRPLSIYQFHPNFVTFWVIVGLAQAFDYYRKYKVRELRTSQLEAQLAQANLQVLKMQLQPHFLFNTLHAISSLMHRDVEAADRMMTRLGDLLRLTLESSGVQEVPLKSELEFLDRYLEIEQTRFRDRLTVERKIDANVLDASVPNLILQPLVENAIRHGIEPFARKGCIEIRAEASNGTLQVLIRDDGQGCPESQQAVLAERVGLSNTRARLQQLYADQFKFEIGNRKLRGFEVKLTIPFVRYSNSDVASNPKATLGA